MSSQFGEAMRAFTFIARAIQNNTEASQEESLLYLHSGAFLNQLKRGVDYWNLAFNYAPSLSLETISNHLATRVIPYMKVLFSRRSFVVFYRFFRIK